MPSIHPIIMNEQHGFRPGRSTIICNITFCNYIFSAFEDHSQVDVVYTDSSKAFDRVNHYALLYVLAHSDLGEPLLSWIGSFISNRRQIVKIHGIKSPSTVVPSGVIYLPCSSPSSLIVPIKYYENLNF
jgi:hypothetical protein